MTRRFSSTALAITLLTTSVATGATGAGQGTDDLGVDFYQQNDFYTTALNKPQSTAQFYQQQVNWMLENDYPPASVIMSSVSRGMTLADTAFFMSKAQPDQAEKIYDLAMDIMPALPGWACSADSGMPNRYDSGIKPDQLPAAPSLEQLSRLYFEEGQRFMEYPEWEQNEGHANISVDELIRFKQQEIELTGEDSWWYRPDDRVKTDVLMVSLYPTERRVVIDARLQDLQAMQDKGAKEVPVMLLYTEQGQIPMSDFNRNPQKEEEGKDSDSPYIDYNDDRISATEVIARFDATSERVSPTRDWHKGDHHLQVQTDELQDLFEIPKKDEIDKADWQRWERQLDQGLEKPLLVSLYAGGDNRWLDEKGLVAVAAERGMPELPVVFFYHSNQRQVCGLPAACTDQLKEAIIKGSEREDLFKPQAGGKPPGTWYPVGGPGGPDAPPEPPASPS